MGFFTRKKKDEPSYSYRSRSAQADAARHLCEQLNAGKRRIPTKARERGPSYHFKSRDDNFFEHTLCVDENGMAAPIADLHGGEGVGGVDRDGGDGNQGIGRLDPQQILAMQKARSQHPAFIHLQQQQQPRQQHEIQTPQQILAYNQRKRPHAQPPDRPLPAQLQQAPARDADNPPFENPFKEALPRGSYGRREYVAGQEKILVGDHGQRYDDPSTSWNMLQSLDRLRKGNGRG